MTGQQSFAKCFGEHRTSIDKFSQERKTTRLKIDASDLNKVKRARTLLRYEKKKKRKYLSKYVADRNPVMASIKLIKNRSEATDML